MNYDEAIKRGGVYSVCLVYLFQKYIIGYMFWGHFKAKPGCLVQVWHLYSPSYKNSQLVNYSGHCKCMPEKPMHVPYSGSFDHLTEKLLKKIKKYCNSYRNFTLYLKLSCCLYYE